VTEENEKNITAEPPATKGHALKEVGALMLRLGLTAFGGPAAHIAMLEREVVQRRRWLSPEAFLDLLGATNLIPGPNSTEMMIHIGMHRAGVPGLWLAGIGFILPAALLTLVLAIAYVSYGTLPQAQGVLAGIKPAVLAIIAAAVWKLGRGAAKTVPLGLLGAGVIVLYHWQGQELALLLGSGVAGILLARSAPLPPNTGESTDSVPPQDAGEGGPAGAAALFWLAPGAAAGAATATPWAIGLYFLKIGSVLFGSGYVLLAFLQEGLVRHHGWLTQQQLLDAVAVGQFTPGPVFSTATFVGYVIAGLPGAAAATLGIFLPSFFFVWATHPLVPRLRRSPWTGGFLDGINIGSVALMAGVSFQLARGTLTAWPAWLIAALSLLVVLRTRINSAWVVLGGALLGWALETIGFVSNTPH
jgi:chromate transporter